MEEKKIIRWTGHWLGITIETEDEEGRNLLETLLKKMAPKADEHYEEGRLEVTREDDYLALVFYR